MLYTVLLRNRKKKAQQAQAAQKIFAEEHADANIERLQAQEKLELTYANLKAQQQSVYLEVSKTWHWRPQNEKADEVIYSEVEFAKKPVKRHLKPAIEETIYAEIVNPRTTRNT